MTEEEIIELLTTHGARGGFLARECGWPREMRDGQWSCACGARGPLGPGKGILAAHRAHVASILHERWKARVVDLLTN